MTDRLRKHALVLVLCLPAAAGCAPWHAGGPRHQFHRGGLWDAPAPEKTAEPAAADLSRNALDREDRPAVVRGQSPGGTYYGGTAVAPLSPHHQQGYHAPQPYYPPQPGQPQAGTQAAPGGLNVHGAENRQVQYQTQPQYIPVPNYQPNALPPEATNVPRPTYPPPHGAMFAPPGGAAPGPYIPGEWIPADGFVPMPPDRFVDIEAIVQETATGRLMLGAGVNSDAGLVGNVLIEEQNFDITRVPRSWNDVLSGSAFRGAGQRLRIEAVPGTELQRYMVSFSEPYLLDTPVSFGISAFYYTRDFRDYDEQRLGGRLSLGYFFRPDLSGTVAFRAENIDIRDPVAPTPPDLLDVLGSNDLYTVRFELTHDTRNNTFLPTGGSYLQLAYEQGMGDFFYPRIELDGRRYFVMNQRPDGSGRHVLGFSGKVGWSGTDTPMFEHFYAGGFSTMRGFGFRGASPLDMDVRVGGEFQLLTSVEYRFPLTANDMVQGSFFVDAGTVERRISSIHASNFRVAPGFELRIGIPALGPVPLAVGFGVPIARADGDDIRNFHFFIGISR